MNRDIIKEWADDELTKIALFAVTSDKRLVKDILVRHITGYFTRKNLTVRYGSGSISYERFIQEFKNTAVYKWGQILRDSKSMEDMVAAVRLYHEDSYSACHELLKKNTWRELKNRYTIDWKLSFDIPRNMLDETPAKKGPPRKKRQPRSFKPVRAAVEQRPELPWFASAPMEIRPILQKLGSASPFQLGVIDQLMGMSESADYVRVDKTHKINDTTLDVSIVFSKK